MTYLRDDEQFVGFGNVLIDGYSSSAVCITQSDGDRRLVSIMLVVGVPMIDRFPKNRFLLSLCLSRVSSVREEDKYIAAPNSSSFELLQKGW